MAHDREVVGDEEVGQAELLLQLLQQVDDLRLDRHVERRHRLVADDEVRLDRERAGDADALALAAGELVRVAVGEVRVQADDRAAAPGRAPAAPCRWPACGSRSGSPMMLPTDMRGFSDA